MKKKAMSEVVATVLLIMITILAISLVAGVIIPMINKLMKESKECFEASDKISIEKDGFTYYNSTNTVIMVRRAISSEFQLKGLAISLALADGSSEVYKIYNAISIEGLRMYNGSSTLEIPDAGEARTYIFPMRSDFVKVAPILLSDKICKEISEKLEERFQ